MASERGGNEEEEEDGKAMDLYLEGGGGDGRRPVDLQRRVPL